MIYLCINLYKSVTKVGIIFRFCKFFLVFFSKTRKILLTFGHFCHFRSIFLHFFVFLTVRLTGLEPARRETLDPKSSASTNSATGADRRSQFVLRITKSIRFANYEVNS